MISDARTSISRHQDSVARLSVCPSVRSFADPVDWWTCPARPGITTYPPTSTSRHGGHLPTQHSAAPPADRHQHATYRVQLTNRSFVVFVVALRHKVKRKVTVKVKAMMGLVGAWIRLPVIAVLPLLRLHASSNHSK